MSYKGMSPRAAPIERLLFGGYEDENGCWLRAAAKQSGGYTQLVVNGKAVYAHRFSYEYHRGDIPAGLILDHLCRNRACFNPWHLEPVSEAENARRGSAANRTHCPAGHEYNKVNTRWYRGMRHCRPCTSRSGRRDRRRGRS